MQKLIVLVIDDEPINIQIISEFLGEEYDIKIAKDGEEGLRAYKKYQPSIIISDINMPNLDGIKMTEVIRQSDLNTKVIFITSHAEVDYILKSTSLKLTKYIIKPINKDELLLAVDNAKKELENYKIVNSSIIRLDSEHIWNFNSLQLIKNEKEITLTPYEKKILNYLLSNANSVKTYDDISYEISEGYETTTKKSLKTMVTNLRKKLPSKLIENIYAIGYKISLPS